VKLTTEDRAAIHDLLARYCWLFDHGEGDAWADLWTNDGSFTGIPEEVHGREALRQMPGGFSAMFDGKLRHHITNIVADHSPEGAHVRAYSMLTDWREAPKLFTFAKIQLQLSRAGAGWKIRSLHAEMLR
jgi:hypothetical protein